MGSARLCVSLRIFPAKDDNLRSQPDCLQRHLPRPLRVNVIMPRAGDRIYVFLIGSISAQFGDESWKFGLGASAASLIFFFCLGYGAALLRPLFSSPVAWRILDFVIGVTMLLLAGKLVFLQI